MKETKNRAARDIIVVGFALFSMFFGAGNVIFPPYLGMESGPQWLAGFSAYFIADIGLALAAMFALLRVGSSEAVLQRVGRVPSEVLMCAIILCVGPMVAIPRTSASTFEMAIAPNLPGVSAVVFSVLFFALILALCIRESAVVDIVGKVLTPLLLAGLAAIIIKGIVTPLGTIAPEAKIDSAVVTGVKAGYQTMDALAALNFGAVIAMNIRAQGVVREQDVQRSAIRAGFIAGGLLLAVYAMLGHAGALTGAAAPGLATGAEVLTVLAERLFGKAGLVLLAAIFMLACFKHLCGADRLCGGVFPHPASPHPLPCSCRLFCRCQYADRKSGAGRYPTVIRPGAQRPVPGSHCADYAFLRARAGAAPPGLSAVHRLHCRAEHCRRAAAWPAFCSCQRPAAGGVGLWLGAPGGHRAAGRHLFKLH